MQNKSLMSLLLSATIAASAPVSFGGQAFAQDASGSAEAGQVAAQDDRPVRFGSLSGAILAARIAEADNDLDDAIDYLRQALNFDSSVEDIRQNLLLALLARGRIDEAIAEANQLSGEGDAANIAQLVLAVDALRAKNYKKVASLLDTGNANDLDQLIYDVLDAWATAGSGDARQAVSDLEAIQGPEFFSLFSNLHKAYIADWAELPEAGDYYANVVDDQRGAVSAPALWLGAVEAYASWAARNDQRERALEILTQGEAIAPELQQLVSLRETIESGERPQPAIRTVREGAAEMLFNVASVLNRSGSEPITRLYLQLASALAPQDGEILFQLGANAEQLGEPEQAIDFYSRVPADLPIKGIADLQLGLNLADQKRWDEAETHLQASIDAEPNAVRPYLALGSIHVAQEEFAEAADVYQVAIDRISDGLDPGWRLYYQNGIALERQQKWAEAEPQFQKALEISPEQPEVLNYLGYTWVDRNENLEDGLDMIRRAVDLRPNAGYIIDSLGWAYYRLGRFDDAVRELERAVSLTPEDPTINDHLGDAYWRSGRRLEARFQWDAALDRNPDEALSETIREKLADGLPDEMPEQLRTKVEAEAAGSMTSGSEQTN